MLELDARPSAPFGDEEHFYFCVESRIVLPIGTNIPGQQKSRRRLPCEDAAPIARASVVTAFVPAPPDTRLHDGIDRIGLADLVHGQWPPASHLLREDVAGNGLRCVHVAHLAEPILLRAAGFLH